MVKVKVNVKFTLEQATKAQRSSRSIYSSTLSLRSALDGVSDQRQAPAVLHPGKRPGTHCIGGWVDPHGRSGRVRKILPPPEFDPRIVQPVASRYRDWAIPAPTECITRLISRPLHSLQTKWKITTTWNVAELFYYSITVFQTQPPSIMMLLSHNHTSWRKKKSVAVEIGLLYYQPPTNNNFHFLIIVKSKVASAAARRYLLPKNKLIGNRTDWMSLVHAAILYLRHLQFAHAPYKSHTSQCGLLRLVKKLCPVFPQTRLIDWSLQWGCDVVCEKWEQIFKILFNKVHYTWQTMRLEQQLIF